MKKLLCTFDDEIDVDVLKKCLRGKHGWLHVEHHAVGTQFFITPTDELPNTGLHTNADAMPLVGSDEKLIRRHS